ncbi:hypothetical protein G3D33_004966 [Salmonella enterica subsp. salamae]|nr:hypothetical protein [Salmonella enterica subsp. salamae]EEI3462484.1 hypothetical protein [Salmonella enterica subsp. salamae]
MGTRRDIRQAIEQSKMNESNVNILFIEIFIISIACGLTFQSWWVFGCLFIGLLVSLNIKILSHILIILLSIGWGGVGCGIGILIDSTGATIILTILGLLIGFGIHLSGLQWVRDISDN